MKQRYNTVILSLLAFTLIQFVSAQEPLQFRNYLQSKYPACYTSDGMGGWIIDPNCPAIVQEDSLDAQGMFLGNYYDNFPVSVVDLQYFTALKYLNLSNNRIVDISAFPPTMEKLVMRKAYSGGPLQGPFFSSLPATLRYFNCDSSFIGSLPSLPIALKYLNCAHNKLNTLPVLPAGLDTLICAGQLEYEERYPTLPSLPALPANLKYLDCHRNALSSIPTLPIALKYLDCSNQFTGSGMPPGEIRRTLTALPAFPNALEYINCRDNKLTTLPVLPASLIDLNCAGNKYVIQNFFSPDSNVGIGALPSLPANLRTLDCSDNNLNCIPRLPASLQTITLDRSRITCLPNTGTYTVLPAGPAIPLCGVTTNANQCSADAVISGSIYYDANSNGVKDPQEHYCASIPVQLSTGVTTYTNDSGYFNLNTALGNYSINATAPAYLNVNPASISYSLTTYDTVVNAIIALQPNSIFDSARVQLIPSVARPGFPYQLLVKLENVGTSVVHANIVLTYDASRLTFINASNPSVSQVGNQLQLQVNNLQPRFPIFFTAYFTTSVSAFGDTLISHATITANTSTSRDSAITVVTGSFDPNDKSATPVLSPAQVAQGTHINYLVRFQNTGTDTAFNIVVTDTLDTKLNVATFELLDASHQVKATREGNNLAFEFLNILLPDSNVNEPLSHGYIRYRVKPLTSVAVGSAIPNKAYIYFDYNEPVLTNVAVTAVEQPLVLFTSYKFIGNGNWDNPSNWQGGNVPPSSISAAVQINIDPAAGGTCIVNVPVTISNQSSLVVATGAKLVVLGNLRINP